MDETIRSAAIERGEVDLRPGDCTKIAPSRVAIAGACIVCRRQTESVVRLDTDVVAFICPPCGRTMRQEAA